MSDIKTSCINCGHYKAVKCELYGWLERMGNFGNVACKDWINLEEKNGNKQNITED